MACAGSTILSSGIFISNANNPNPNRYSVISSSYFNKPLHHKLSNNTTPLLPTTKRGLLRIRGASEKESSSSMATEIAGVKVINNPPESKLTDLGVRSWPKWGCPPSKFPWTYSAKETCYLLKGKVKVYPDGSNQAVEIGAGYLVEFPKGMSCTWDVSEEVDKHYKFE
ncbi:uncharacterized protein LOC132055203 [Lycium ferocissimum]|uniref:uncharacterized protein LOC132055203 n=1 Tax=Lycium ferocissimum TaxID=112874 RepID=UPI0028151F9D|nr:uncharacterized protein LOC132055203 [Lycium ferocissimum]